MKHHISLLIALAFGVILFAGCLPASDPAAPDSKPTGQLPAVTATREQTATVPAATAVQEIPVAAVTTTEEQTATVAPTATATEEIPTETPSPTSTATLTPTPARSSAPERICTDLPVDYELMDTLDIFNIAHLSFADDETILFDGWASRPEPHVLAGEPPPAVTRVAVTPGPDPGLPSARLLFKSGQINLASGEIVTHTLSFEPLLGNPCGEQCPLEILSQSPDARWQLVQVSDWREDQIGFWLVGLRDMVHLVEYVPAYSTWHWAVDSSLLWLVHTTGERGVDAVMVRLSDPPVVMRLRDSRRITPLDATYYLLAFSPENKTVLSTGNPFELGSPDTDELYMFDISQESPQKVAEEIIPGLETITWNEANHTFLLVTIQEDGLEIRNPDGATLVKVPLSTFQGIYPGMSASRLTNVLPYENYALSPSGRYLAIGYGGPEGVRVFECREPASS